MRLFAFLLLALVLAGCGSTSSPRVGGGGVPASEPPPDPAPPADAASSADVLIGSVSITGEWTAVGALDEPDADTDLRSGMLVRRLTVERGGAAILSGEDRRAGTQPEYYDGQVTGNALTFDDLPGEATLEIRSDGRLVFTDPRGRRTVYERE
ncbi:MAG: hypothetical protein AAGI91_06890 [Bacteroidota bacterium]